MPLPLSFCKAACQTMPTLVTSFNFQNAKCLVTFIYSKDSSFVSNKVKSLLVAGSQ